MERVIYLIDQNVFFDADGMSAFLWVDKTSILEQLYKGNIIIPEQVYDELNHPSIQHLTRRLDNLISRNVARKEIIEIGSNAADLYFLMTHAPEDGRKVIGSGEAAAIALVRDHGGILASNNLKDISPYIDKYNIDNLTTGDILTEALDNGIITEEQGNEIWKDMLKHRRKIGGMSFTQFLSAKKS